MQKLYKNNYILVKSHLPIILLDTIEKTLELIFIKKISAIAKMHYHISKTFFKQTKTTSTKYVVYYLVKKTYVVWSKKKKTFALI